MYWEMKIGGDTLAGCQGIRVEARGSKPGALHTLVNLKRLIIGDEDMYLWLTRVYPWDGIPPEARRDFVLRDKTGAEIDVRGAAPISVLPPMEPPNQSGVLGGVTLSVNSIAVER